MEALIEAKYQHKMDSIKLAEAEAKLNQSQETPAAPEATAAPEASSSSSSHESATPAHSGSNYGTEFDWLSERECTYDDVSGLSGWDLCVLRNSMYARHGRKFKRADLREYFGQFSWYHPRYDEVKLTSLEMKNVKFIKQFE